MGAKGKKKRDWGEKETDKPTTNRLQTKAELLSMVELPTKAELL